MGIDQLGATATGEVMIRGRIPSWTKIGYDEGLPSGGPQARTMKKRTQSDELFERASKVVPGGIYGHVSPAAGLPRHFPHFCDWRARGPVCGRGWKRVARLHVWIRSNSSRLQSSRNRRSSDTTKRKGINFQSTQFIDGRISRDPVDRIDFTEWSVFAKNGSDLTTWAIRVAREFTGDPQIKAKWSLSRGGSWCDPGHGGRIPDDRASIIDFDWNDLESLSLIMSENKGKVAALVLTPYHHTAFAPSELPAPGFWAGVEKLCRRNDVLLILDDGGAADGCMEVDLTATSDLRRIWRLI